MRDERGSSAGAAIFAAAGAVLLMALWLSGAAQGADAPEQAGGDVTLYQWIATESAPADFPAHVIGGDLVFKGGSAYVPDHRVAKNGWGMRGASHLVGDPMRPVPTELRLTWFSYPEDRFYRGVFTLPAARMETLFAQGAISPRNGEKIAYDAIIVGMAPGGAVAVWMAAGAMVLEVAAFRAAQVDLPWTLVLDNPAIARADHVRAVLEDAIGPEAAAALQSAGMPKGVFERRHTRHAWAPAISGDGAPDSLWIRYWNGENEPFLVEGAAPPRVMRAAPRQIRLGWTDPGGTAISGVVDIDEAEIHAAFATLLLQGAATEAVLDLRIAPGGQGLRATLKTAHGALRLRDAKISLFRRRE